MTFASLIEGKEMLETVVASVVAGLGVTAAFSVAIWGVGRFIELSGRGDRLAAGGAALVAGFALAIVGSALVFGIVVMTSN
jgi:cation transporter-like permease